MRMSTKAQYAVRALVSLNLTSDGDPVSIKDISSRENISLNYLEQLFVKLRRGEIVKSVRGPGGGYMLARPAADIRVDEIIDTVEETWMKIVVDNREPKEYNLFPGDQIELEATDSYTLLIGNAGGVKLRLNGKLLDIGGKSGQVTKVTLP